LYNELITAVSDEPTATAKPSQRNVGRSEQRPPADFLRRTATVRERQASGQESADPAFLNTGILDESVERPREQELGSDAVVRSNFVRRDALVSA
jgi:hypothetical protein